MKSEQKPKVVTHLPEKNEDNNTDVDDGSQSENELRIITSSGESRDETESDTEVGKCLSNTSQLTKINANYFFEELTSDDEILTFQCPQNFNVSSLLNQVINMNKVTKIQDDGNKFKCQVLETDNKTLTCVFPTKKDDAAFVNIPLAGHIVVNKSLKLPKKNIITEDINRTDKIILKNTVMRHPLLGKDWNEHLSTARKQIKKHEKLLKKSNKQKKSWVKAEKERKQQEKQLRAQLSLLQKSLRNEVVSVKRIKWQE